MTDPEKQMKDQLRTAVRDYLNEWPSVLVDALVDMEYLPSDEPGFIQLVREAKVILKWSR